VNAHRGRRRYRAIWISDTHLGTRGCKIELLRDFLDNHEADELYLVGDIIDFWRLKRSRFWNAAHNDVVRRTLKMARNGTRVVYVPGNHDEALRSYGTLQLGNIHVVKEAVHECANGKKLLVIHGDEFDAVTRYARWLAVLGDWAYVLALWLNSHFNRARQKLGYPYWSLSAYLKRKVKNAVEYISNFEEALAHEARRRGVDGVVCGHIHHAEIREIDGILYCNDGDWVESCTALVEHADGALEIVRWHEPMPQASPLAIDAAA